MNTLQTEFAAAAASAVRVDDNSIEVDLLDGRTITAPLAWFPRLLHGTATEKNNWRPVGRGQGIHWPDLDEDVSIEGLLAGRRSGESPQSLAKWLKGRQKS